MSSPRHRRPDRALGLLLGPPLATGALGVLVLRHHGVGVPRLALMLAAMVLGALLTVAIMRRGFNVFGRVAPALGIGALALLAASLAGDGLLGVERWIAIGPVRLHASSVASPIVLAAAAALLARGRAAWAALGVALAQSVHALQPDAGQSTALALGVAAGLCMWPGPPRVRVLAVVLVLGSVVPAWMAPDPLAPVAEVEGVVGLAAQIDIVVAALAVLLLASMPASLVVLARHAPPQQRHGAVARATCIALAGYVAGLVLAPLLGDFPVPVLGFGVAPVLGVAICMGAAAAFTRADDPAMAA